MIGLTLLAFGIFTLKAKHLFYSNYWGGAVFAPLVIIVGVILLLIGLFKKDIF